MNPYELTAAITALAAVIAERIPNSDELTLLASSLKQLSDTLATIIAQRRLQEAKPPENEII